MRKFNELNHKQEREIVIEKIIEWVIKESGGQLVIFKPTEDIIADLVVRKRGKYEGSELYFQVHNCEKSVDKFVKNISPDKFKSVENFYLIFTFFDPIKQDINDYLWFLPFSEFENLSEPELKFQVSINLQEKNKYTNFLINKKELGRFLLEIVDSGKFKRPKSVLEEVLIIDQKKLKKFVTEARENTFTGGGIPVGNPRLTGSKQMDYQRGDYFYRNIYFEGGNSFIGQEIVYQDNKPVWAMVYFGNIMPKEPKELSKFFKKSLSILSEKCRFGQECQLEEDEFRYEDKGKGEFEKFEGEEGVFIKDKEIYKLKYLGGLI